MATVAERVSVVETKVEAINEKIDDIKNDVRENHTELKEQLKTMYDASCTQHAELAKKISSMEKFKDKWVYTVTGCLIVLSWATAHFDDIMKIVK